MGDDESRDSAVVDDVPTRALNPDDLDTEAGAFPADAHAATSLIGQKLGRYTVLEKLGSGGMGEVLLGYDPELNRRVAIKLLRLDKAADDDGIFQERLLREAQALARLSHPNVVSVYDVGTALGRIWVAMEYVEGVTLTEYRKSERPWRELVTTIGAAGRGLAAAHREGIVHRDFKPGNVMIGSDGRVRVLDFGLARTVAPVVVSHTSSVSSDSLDIPASALRSQSGAMPALTDSIDVERPLTETGSLMGTPAYMAPEQFTQDTIDDRTDQFAFCIVLYEALYRRRPFSGRTARELARSVVRGQVREPPRGRVPARIRRVVMRGLSVDPAKRFDDLDALLAALARAERPFGVPSWVAPAVVGASVVAVVLALGARETTPCEGAEAHMQQAWSDSAKPSVAESFAATGLVYAESTAELVSAALDDYARAWTEAHAEACRATRVRGEQSEALMDLRIACLDARRQEVGALVELFGEATPETVENAVQAVSRLESVEPCSDPEFVRAAVPPPTDPKTREAIETERENLSRAKALMIAGQYGRAGESASAVIERAVELEYPALAAEAGMVAEQAATRSGNQDEALRLLSETLRHAEAAGHDRARAQLLAELAGQLGYHQSDLASARRYVKQAEGLVERLGNPPALQAILSLNEANAFLRAASFDEARAKYEAAAEAAAKDSGSSLVELAAVGNLAVAYGMQGLHDKSAEVSLRAVELHEQLLGAGHPTVGVTSLNAGAAYLAARKLEEGEKWLERAEEILSAAFPDGHPELAKALHNHASILSDRGDDQRSLELYRQALQMKTRLMGADHPSTALSIVSVGAQLRKLGKHEEAMRQFTRALETWKSKLGEDHPWNAFAHLGVGQIALAEQRPEDAVAAFERAVAVQEGAGVQGHDLGEARFLLARSLHLAEQDHDRAVELAKKAKLDYRGQPDADKELEAIDTWLAKVTSVGAAVP